MRHLALVTLALLLATSCAANRGPVKPLEIRAKPPLTQSDIQEITRVVSEARRGPMLWIHRMPRQHGHEAVDVFTDTPNTAGTAFILEKVGSRWIITSQG